MLSTQPPPERAILVGVATQGGDSTWSLADSLAELGQLAASAGVQVAGQLTQRLDAPNATSYIGKGKVQELAQLRRQTPYDIVIVDEELSPGQQRSLEEALEVQVMDRAALILDIFAQRAHTHEGRLQVELAQYEYYLPRLTRLWTHLSRQTRGGVGLRGPGETQLESDRRGVRRRISDLKRELEEVRTHRALYRHHRREEMIPVVALVGYTNAGKSTLLNALTGADVLVEDKLFATLDPTTRRVKLGSGQEVLLTDTVGFIQKLPTQLVAAFRATLEELSEADVLVHVLDITHPNAAEQTQVVTRTLLDLGLGDTPTVTALNKIDRLLPQDGTANPGEDPRMTAVRQVAAPYPDAVAISAARGIGLADLLARVESVLSQGSLDITVCIPYDQGDLVALLHRQGSITSETYVPGGTRLQVRAPRRLQRLLQPFAVSG